MFTIETFTTFLGWCSVINIGILLFTTLLLLPMNEWVANIHGRLFGIKRTDVQLSYFNYLANYKIVVLVFNLAPYIALKVMA